MWIYVSALGYYKDINFYTPQGIKSYKNRGGLRKHFNLDFIEKQILDKFGYSSMKDFVQRNFK